MVSRIFIPALAAALYVSASAFAAAPDKEQAVWRIRFLEAAVVAGPAVRLGEVAVPVGDFPAEVWRELAGRELWPAPEQAGKPVNMTRPRLQEAVVRTMNDLAPNCLFPGSLALQRGGSLFSRGQIRDAAVSQLTPALATLPGEASLSDMRLPPFLFAAHDGQTLEVELPRKIAAGRLNFRFLVRDLDGSVTQKISASAFVDCWLEVPAAAAPLNRGDVLEPGGVTFIRANLAHLRGEVWDGRGGPWRLLRPIGLDQVIYQADLGHVPTVRKGGLVTLLYEGAHLRLTAPGEALADGVPGESIPVRNARSRKQLYGIVRDASTVIVSAAL
ncbi:MAG: flagellar basal body P-ring formation chaperone FlgA [Desulfovibrio sp.]|jgi:flagella basal body P-ring formation protein FlgA|nr:flagellar basal body P-ring formation chaperone FlgA [Desulfovibrio sp.]